MDYLKLKQQLSGIACQDLEQRKSWYSPSAEAYNSFRPKYPRELVQEAIEIARLSDSSRVLEIGCGPGAATVSFAEVGCPMVCLEPNPDFYELAIMNCQPYPSVNLINQSLEEWDLEPQTFDAVLAASSMHWIPAEIGYAKAHAALKEGGHLILLWNKEPQPCESIQNALAPIYQQHAPALGRFEDRQTQETILKGLGQMMIESGLFANLIAGAVEARLSYAPDQYISLLSTYSPYLKLDQQARGCLFAGIKRRIFELGMNQIHLSYLSAYHVGQKASG
jgi:SAM-dependent methyltransferase